MKRRLSGALVALALSPLAVSQANAQTIFNYTDFWAQCTPGLFVACSSVSIWNELVHETGEIYMGVRVSNLQGTPGFRDLDPVALNILTINNVRTAPDFVGSRSSAFGGQFGELSEEGTSQCNTFGYCTDSFVGDEPFFIPAGDGLWHLVLHIGSSGQWLWGCDTDHSSPNYAAPSTCGGYLSWRLRPRAFDGQRIVSYAMVPTQETSLYFSYTEGAPCTTGVDCITVTPEPATILLLAGGLLGIAVVTRRRRLS